MTNRMLGSSRSWTQKWKLRVDRYKKKLKKYITFSLRHLEQQGKLQRTKNKSQIQNNEVRQRQQIDNSTKLQLDKSKTANVK